MFVRFLHCMLLFSYFHIAFFRKKNDSSQLIFEKRQIFWKGKKHISIYHLELLNKEAFLTLPFIFILNNNRLILIPQFRFQSNTAFSIALLKLFQFWPLWILLGWLLYNFDVSSLVWFSTLPYFIAMHDVPGSSCIFPLRALASPLSERSPGAF